MQSILTFAFVVFVAVAGTARGDDDCTEIVFHGQGCCDMVGAFPLNKLKIINETKCYQKYYKKEKKPTTSSEWKNYRACISECILSEEGLVTDGKLDRAATTKALTPQVDAFRPAIYNNIEKCFGSYQADVDSTSECKSGGFEFGLCFVRETFLNCPSSKWSATPECGELKANITKCPKIPVRMDIITQT